MNAYYHYSYTNGVQFISTANQITFDCHFANFQEGSEKPKLIGVWRFKKINNKNK